MVPKNGALNLWFLKMGLLTDGRTDRQLDGQRDGQTEKLTYRSGCPA